MPRYIVKVGDRYGEWSTIVDAPVSKLMPLDEFTAYYAEQYGKNSLPHLSVRLSRVEAKGTSEVNASCADDTMDLNRYGDGGERISVKRVIEKWKQATDFPEEPE